MVEAGDGPGFSDEAFAEVRLLGEVGPQDLEGDDPVHRELARAEDGTHASLPDFREDFVTGDRILLERRFVLLRLLAGGNFAELVLRQVAPVEEDLGKRLRLDAHVPHLLLDLQTLPHLLFGAESELEDLLDDLFGCFCHRNPVKGIKARPF